MTEKQVTFDIKLPQNWFESKNIDISDFQKHVEFLGKSFGTRYADIFATKIHDTKEADYIINTSIVLIEISDLAGFSRFVKLRGGRKISDQWLRWIDL